MHRIAASLRSPNELSIVVCWETWIWMVDALLGSSTYTLVDQDVCLHLVGLVYAISAL